jgi:hypothetical protein
VRLERITQKGCGRPQESAEVSAAPGTAFYVCSQGGQTRGMKVSILDEWYQERQKRRSRFFSQVGRAGEGGSVTALYVVDAEQCLL